MEWNSFFAAAGGAMLGGIFFGGLWLTVMLRLEARAPWLWFLASMLLRTSVMIAGFVLIAGSSPARLLWCAGGFTATRMLIVRIARIHGYAAAANVKEEACT